MLGCIVLDNRSKPVYSVLDWNAEGTQCLVVRRRMVWRRGKIVGLGYNGLPLINPLLTMRAKVWMRAERLSFFDLEKEMQQAMERMRKRINRRKEG